MSSLVSILSAFGGKRSLRMRGALAIVATPPLLLSPNAFGQELGAMKAFAQACRADAAQLCEGVAPGGGRVLACLREQPQWLSSDCSRALGNGPVGRSGFAGPELSQRASGLKDGPESKNGRENSTETELNSPAARVQALKQTATPEGSMAAAGAVLRDVPYGTDSAQKMDVYLPAVPPVDPGPMIMMAHGGAWRFGDKASPGMIEKKAKHWNQRGIVVISVNYRLLPQATPVEQAQDVARAIAFAQKNAEKWRANPASLVLMGHSSGAQIAALLASDPGLAAAAGAKQWAGTIALDSAALDIESVMRSQHYAFYDAAFGSNPADWRAASPWAQLTAPSYPMLMVCSSRRRDSCPQARAFAKKDEDLGARIAVLPVDGSHRDINVQVGEDNAETLAIDRFVFSLVGDGRRG